METRLIVGDVYDPNGEKADGRIEFSVPNGAFLPNGYMGPRKFCAAIKDGHFEVKLVPGNLDGGNPKEWPYEVAIYFDGYAQPERFRSFISKDYRDGFNFFDTVNTDPLATEFLPVRGVNGLSAYEVAVLSDSWKPQPGVPLVEDEHDWVESLKGGERGERGPQGPRGAAGPRGETGPAGAAGPKGDDGPTGPAGQDGGRGPAGSPGPQGVEGPRGLPGEAGTRGPQGERGPVGPQGLRGERGADGAPGPAGRDGAPGERGQDGAAGARGPEGPQGPKGDFADLTNGFTASGGKFKVNADGEITSVQVDHIWEAIDKAVAGEGGVGMAEVQREIGKHNTAVSAHEDIRQAIRDITLTPGPQGKEGPQGPAGKDGPPGERGEKGPAGKDGERGLQGAQGPKGDPGADGRNGSDGGKGDPGQKGDPGTPGAAGKDGNRWYIDTGVHGPPEGANEGDCHLNKSNFELEWFDGGDWQSMGSIRGYQGPPGTPGRDGVDGAEGKQGPKGDPGLADVTKRLELEKGFSARGGKFNIEDEGSIKIATGEDGKHVLFFDTTAGSEVMGLYAPDGRQLFYIGQDGSMEIGAPQSGAEGKWDYPFSVDAHGNVSMDGVLDSPTITTIKRSLNTALHDIEALKARPQTFVSATEPTGGRANDVWVKP
ncbi:hypothetical protein ACFYYS_00200 [Streptomyces sp. NPDC002120]|uniref:hypothetical protein n=1 Tax=Streptomyces sp. NPDC002120 TaxID=3364631 RepID=UPI0036CBD789